MKKLFGTDGVRGRANHPPMTGETAMRIGMSVTHHFRQKTGHGKFIIGKDTRLSGYLFETALAGGITAAGGDVLLVGPMPTPGIAFLTREMRADAGAVISASHNPYEDNGIKLFDRAGYKLPDEVELKIEEQVLNGHTEKLHVDAPEIGKAFRIDDASGRYITHLKNSFPGGLTLEGFTIVLDCAHGAAYRIAPLVFEELGAKVISLGVQPDGKNINDGVGSLHPAGIQEAVVQQGAQLGIALDGDADRVVFCDENGDTVDGDAVLAVFAKALNDRGRLKNRTLVTTVMSNMGLHRAMEAEGVRVIDCRVGDRYVTESLLAGDLNFGGENSGHLIFMDHATTGDGTLAGLQMAALMVETGVPLSQLGRLVELMPQRLINFEVESKPPLEKMDTLQREIEEGRKILGRYGKILVRYSGTEAKARVLVEGDDPKRVEDLASSLVETLMREVKSSQ